MSYLIIDLESGLMDGWYALRADAEHVRSGMRRDNPGVKWIILENAGPDEFNRIPDERFYANAQLAGLKRVK